MASGKRPIAATEVVEEEEEEGEEDEGQQQHQKRQRLATNTSDSDDEAKATSEESDIPVNVKAKMPDSIPLADDYEGGEFFFVRKCYAEYYLKVEALLVKENKPCVTVTGTPGIGKSLFYAFFVDRFRKTHVDWTIVASTYAKDRKIMQLTVFEPRKKTEVYARATQSKLEEIMSRLHEGDMEAGQPNAEVEKKVLWLCDGPPQVKRRQMVVFTSPNEWLSVAKNNGQTYYMPPWTLEEFQLAISVLGYPFTDDEIESRFWKFGGVARNCFMFDLARIPSEIDYLTGPIAAITDSGDLRNLLVRTPNDDTHHRFLLYDPKGDGRRCNTEIVSDMVRQKLGEQLFSVIEGNVNEVEASLKGIPPAASLRGWIFEARAHVKLQHTSYFDARPLAVPKPKNLKNERIFMLPSDEIDIFQGNAISPTLLNNEPYHKPKEKNFESIDGFFFPKLPVGGAPTMDEKNNRILLFQMTVSMDHPVRASGVIYLLEKLGLLDLVKDNPKRAALVFVRPTDGSKDFKKQPIRSGGTPPQQIGDLKGIGPETVDILATYNVTSIADLESKVEDFDTGRIAPTNKKHKAAWARVVRSWKQQVQYLKDQSNIKMVEEIPQYACPLK